MMKIDTTDIAIIQDIYDEISRLKNILKKYDKIKDFIDAGKNLHQMMNQSLENTSPQLLAADLARLADYTKTWIPFRLSPCFSAENSPEIESTLQQILADLQRLQSSIHQQIGSG